MGTINQLLAGVRQTSGKLLRRSAMIGVRWLGYELFTKQQTEAFLAPYRLATQPASSLALPEIVNQANSSEVIFPETQILTQLTHIWRYEPGPRKTTILPCGVVLTDRKVLNTDYWSHDLFKNAFGNRHRPVREVEIVIAPFSHYFDDNVFVGYYDYMQLVAAKISRIKAAMAPEEFERAVVAYPLVNTTYERDFLTLMGFGPQQIIDTRLVDVRAGLLLLGNHTNWAHQNAADLFVLKTEVEKKLPVARAEKNRLYISRSCRRRVVNEGALIDLLTRHGFQIIEDKPRSLAEQVALYKNASYIIGPHGASFANLVWCEPGTQIFELFAPQYAPNYFLYLAQLMGLRYAAYSEGHTGQLKMETIGEDITISIARLEQALPGLFVTE